MPMKILILGPVINKKTSGGVAVFTEELNNGFISLGHTSNILSIGKSDKIDNLVVNGSDNSRKIWSNLGRFADRIREFRPDEVICSLQYIAGIKKYIKKWPFAKYIMVIHGQPVPTSQGIVKAKALELFHKRYKKYFYKTVNVSFLSAAIIQSINGIKCDDAIFNGTSMPVPTREELSRERKYDFVYVGRLFRDKNVEMMMESLVLLHKKEPNLRVAVAGFGEQESLFTKGKYKLDFIDFKGRLDRESVRKLLLDSKTFINLCVLESCGIAVLEAAMCGCGIAVPPTTGSVPLFYDMSFYHPVSFCSIEKLANDYRNIYFGDRKINSEDIATFAKRVSWETVSQQYIELINQ